MDDESPPGSEGSLSFSASPSWLHDRPWERAEREPASAQFQGTLEFVELAAIPGRSSLGAIPGESSSVIMAE